MEMIVNLVELLMKLEAGVFLSRDYTGVLRYFLPLRLYLLPREVTLPCKALFGSGPTIYLVRLGYNTSVASYTV